MQHSERRLLLVGESPENKPLMMLLSDPEHRKNTFRNNTTTAAVLRARSLCSCGWSKLTGSSGALLLVDDVLPGRGGGCLLRRSCARQEEGGESNIHHRGFHDEVGRS